MQQSFVGVQVLNMSTAVEMEEVHISFTRWLGLVSDGSIMCLLLVVQ